MNDIAAANRPAPDGLFVIACPTCFGHVAASAGMAGQPACCPLCAGTFVVPPPQAAPPQAAPPPPPAARPAEPPVAQEPATPPQVAAQTAAIEPTLTEAPPAADGLAADGLAAAPPADDPFATPPLQTMDTAPAAIAELRFQEPVKTVGRGANTIELRRLTDEDRRIRRGRRNILLLLVGAAILMIVVMIFGTPRRKR